MKPLSGASGHATEMRLAIVNALDSIMANSSYDDVSIERICEVAHISRPTFYRYFDRKDDIFPWLLHHLAYLGTYRIGKSLTWYEGDLATTSGMMRYRNIVRGQGRARQNDSTFEAECRIYEEYFLTTLALDHELALDRRLRVQVRAAVLARIDLLSHWADDGMPFPVEELAELMSAVVPEPLFGILNNPPQRAGALTTEDPDTA